MKVQRIDGTKIKRVYLLVLVAIFLIGMVYGISIHRYQVFPYEILKLAYIKVSDGKDASDYGPWSIGIYRGSSPFDLHDPEEIANPVLTGRDVTDVDALFVADPFMAIEDDRFYMFFEVLNRSSSQGDIGYAESHDGEQWEYKNIIIDEPFHLSYPYVFKWEGQYYMIPESHEDLSIRLYRAASFPGKWEFVQNIFNGEHYVDPSIFRHENLWWLFYANPKNDALNLYYSTELTGEWKPHPMNPIVKLDKHIARPGGRVLVHNGKIYRFAQDADPRYGIQIFAFEILELSPKEYQEKMVREQPIVTMTGKGWNAKGMHHVDPHYVQGKWIATVDGRNR